MLVELPGLDHRGRRAHLGHGLQAAGVQQPHRALAGHHQAAAIVVVAGLGDRRIEAHDPLGACDLQRRHRLPQRVFGAVVAAVLLQRGQRVLRAAHRVLRQRQHGAADQVTRLRLLLQRAADHRRTHRHRHHADRQRGQGLLATAPLLAGPGFSGGTLGDVALQRLEAHHAGVAGFVGGTAGAQLQPGGSGVVGALPFACPFQAAAAQQLAALLAVAAAVFNQPAGLGRGIGLGRHPAAQALPLADQAFVRDVDHRVGRQRPFGARHQKGGVGPAVALDHLGHVGDALLGAVAADGAELGEFERAAHFGAFGHAFGQRAEHPLDHAAGLAQRPERVTGFVGMVAQRAGGAAGGLVVLDVDRPRAAAHFGPALPGAGQRVLHHRQVVEVVADVVEQALHQPRRDPGAAQLDRLDDGLFALLALEPRHQVAAAAHRLGQVGEIGAGAQRVRAQRQHHADR